MFDSKPSPTLFSPAQASEALIVIDMINDFGFRDGEELFVHANDAAKKLGVFIRRARSAGIPVIYVNDSFGEDPTHAPAFARLIRKRSDKADAIIENIRPEKTDFLVPKPQRSGFYATALGSILLEMRVSTVYLAGVTTDICVLFTAHDAYMRDFKIKVPEDCSAAVKQKHHRQAIELLKRVTEADVRPSAEMIFAAASGKETTAGSHSRGIRKPGLVPVAAS